MTEQEIIAAAEEYPLITGVYFLIQGDEIVYVGQSLDIMARIAQHRNNGKVFSKFTYIQVAPEHLDDVETEYIVRFWPKYNGDLLPCYDKWVTLNFLVRIFKGTKINRHRIKKHIATYGIEDVNGFYLRSTFDGLIKEIAL